MWAFSKTRVSKSTRLIQLLKSVNLPWTRFQIRRGWKHSLSFISSQLGSFLLFQNCRGTSSANAFRSSGFEDPDSAHAFRSWLNWITVAILSAVRCLASNQRVRLPIHEKSQESKARWPGRKRKNEQDQLSLAGLFLSHPLLTRVCEWSSWASCCKVMLVKIFSKPCCRLDMALFHVWTEEPKELYMKHSFLNRPNHITRETYFAPNAMSCFVPNPKPEFRAY